MVKPEKFDLLLLVYHFTVPLKVPFGCFSMLQLQYSGKYPCFLGDRYTSLGAQSLAPK